MDASPQSYIEIRREDDGTIRFYDCLGGDVKSSTPENVAKGFEDIDGRYGTLPEIDSSFLTARFVDFVKEDFLNLLRSKEIGDLKRRLSA